MANARFTSPKWLTVRGLVAALICTYLGPSHGISTAVQRSGAVLPGEKSPQEKMLLSIASTTLGRRGLRGLNSGIRKLSGEEDDEAVTPEQLHLALADASPRDTYAMSVSWLTQAQAASQVFWGVTESDLGEVVFGDSTNYTTNHVNIQATTYTSGVLHSATMTELEPSTTYYYTCGDQGHALSTVRSFRTPGRVGLDEPITIGILGDLGQTNDSLQTLSAVLAHNPPIDMVLHAGDLSYANCNQTMWDTFMTLLDPTASRVPWMVSTGNHEIEDGSTVGGPFNAYEHRFNMPAVAPAIRNYDCSAEGGGLDGNETACGAGLGEGLAMIAALKAADDKLPSGAIATAARRAREAQDPWRRPVMTGWSMSDSGEEETAAPINIDCCPSEWSGTYDYGNSFYSFDVASVHVVVLNPYTATGEGSIQHEWLIQDLADADRTLTPWILVMFHCPWHNSNLSHQGERQAATAMRVMEPLLFQYGVALILSGHVHAYERSVPVLTGIPTTGAPVQVVVGGSGNREHHDPDYFLLPEWSAFRNGSAFGLGTLSIYNSTTALWEWKSNAPQPVVHDSTWIANPFFVERS